MDELKHSLRSAASPIIESLTGDTLKPKLPQLESEHITTWGCSLSEARVLLSEKGYTYQVFAARKFHERLGRDSGSYAKVDQTNKQMQFHVHLYESENGVLVYSHHEFRPIHPIKHLNSKDYTKGKACEKVS